MLFLFCEFCVFSSSPSPYFLFCMHYVLENHRNSNLKYALGCLYEGNCNCCIGYVDNKRLILSNLQHTKPLMVSHVRSMKMNDDVQVVAVSPDAKYIAAALLDCTVKVR